MISLTLWILGGFSVVFRKLLHKSWAEGLEIQRDLPNARVARAARFPRALDSQLLVELTYQFARDLWLRVGISADLTFFHENP
jgi:hypothetical protein